LTSTRLDWQLKIQAHDIVDSKKLSKENIDFANSVNVIPTTAPSSFLAPPRQRAIWAKHRSDLVRIVNKPVLQLKVQKTGHILEIAREDVYERDTSQSFASDPESRWTASLYNPKWANDLGEFAYIQHGQKPDWEPSLATFFPEPEDAIPLPGNKPRGPRDFIKVVEEMKNILWEATRLDTDRGKEGAAMASERIGTLDSAGREIESLI
jgi:hypothetical protein